MNKVHLIYVFEGNLLRGARMGKKPHLPYVLIFFIFFISSLSHAAGASGPKIYFDEPVFDAKDIKSGEYLEHTYKVMNKGDSTLEISDVKPG
jgi:hypothetical protein